MSSLITSTIRCILDLNCFYNLSNVVDILFKTILDILFPPFCAGCGKFGVVICLKCIERIEFNHLNTCLVCGGQSIKGFTHPSCATFYTPERFISPFVYSDLVRKAILEGKFRGKTFYLYETLADIAYYYLYEVGIAFGNEALVIPVPLSHEKLSLRGFNQSDVIAQVLAARFGVPFVGNVLKKIKETRPQSRLARGERFVNVSGVFQVSALVHGKDVLLVDDVFTTRAPFFSFFIPFF